MDARQSLAYTQQLHTEHKFLDKWNQDRLRTLAYQESKAEASTAKGAVASKKARLAKVRTDGSGVFYTKRSTATRNALPVGYFEQHARYDIGWDNMDENFDNSHVKSFTSRREYRKIAQDRLLTKKARRTDYETDEGTVYMSSAYMGPAPNQAPTRAGENSYWQAPRRMVILRNTKGLEF